MRLGAEVTLIEATATPLAHVLPGSLGAWFAELHRAEGVRVELGVAVAEALPAVAGAPVRSLVLADGRSIATDAVLVAVGVVPETRWLAGSPLEGDGVAVDGGGRTAVPHVYAAGDVAGCEHWEPAARLGTAAARSILGLPRRGRAAAELLERPVRPAHPARRLGGRRRRASRSTAAAHATSPRSCAARGALVGALLVGRPRELPLWRRRLADARQPQSERNAA